MATEDAISANPKTRAGNPVSPATQSGIAGSAAIRQRQFASGDEPAGHVYSSFLANISHEFRTPLSALNASVEYLLDDFDQLTRNEIHELLSSIHLSVTGLQALIDNLLESANMEAGRFAIRPRPVRLGDVVAEALRIMQPLVNRRFQRVCVNKSSAFPLVYGDCPRLTQVLVNLLSNASKFGPMNQTISLYSEFAGDGKVRVAVADRGPGILLEDKASLFQRFQRLGSPDGAQYGIGLGLSVVKTIVKEHGGEVGVDERPGGGSIFWFTLPLAVDEI